MGDYRTLPYYGGKRGYGKAGWIASFLPWYSVPAMSNRSRVCPAFYSPGNPSKWRC